ncbi:MAG: helicase-related protein, partial [bacterium]
GPESVVSTPGRLIDLLEQKALKLDQVKYLILDEADEMLSFGFKDALESIWQTLASNESKAKTWLFSATMSSSILKLTSQYLDQPVEVLLNEKQTPIKVQSFAAVVYEEDKLDALALAILNEPQFYGIVFAQTKKQVADLEILLRSLGLDVDSLHGDKAQVDRNRTIGRFKKRETKILVATDVAARGLDVADLTHVVNFELPWDVETYTHRIGRTARAGKEGTVWN